MENAADALKMAGWLLIFIVALGFSMNVFSNIVRNVDSMMMDADREYNTKYIEGNKAPNGNLITKRLVSVESILPTIYRCFKDSRYKVLIEDNTLFSLNGVKKNYIDSTELKLSKDKERKNFIKGLMYGADALNTTEKAELSINKGIEFNNNGLGLYDKLKDNKLVESIGLYYLQEVEGSDSNLPEAQMKEKRIITYSFNY